MSEQSEVIAGTENPVEKLSFEELITLRTQARTPDEENEQEESEDEEAEEDAEQSEETEEESEDETSEETEEEERQSIDLESLTPEQIQDLAKKGKSRLLADIGKLRKQNRELLEQAQSNQANAKPLPKTIPADENPFRDLKTIKEIEEKRGVLEQVAEDTDRLLDEYDHYGPEDVIVVEGKEYTKAQIKAARRNAQQGLLKFLPAQEAEIGRAEERAVRKEQFEAAIPLQIPEMADEESELFQQYKAMRDDPLTEKVRQSVPELSPQFNWLLAHAANSILKVNKTPRQPVAATKTRPKVAGLPFGTGAAKSRTDSEKEKVKKAESAYEATGSEEALIAARAARHANR